MSEREMERGGERRRDGERERERGERGKREEREVRIDILQIARVSMTCPRQNLQSRAV